MSKIPKYLVKAEGKLWGYWNPDILRINILENKLHGVSVDEIYELLEGIAVEYKQISKEELETR